MRPLPPGDPPRSCEQETLMEAEAQSEGPLATDLFVANNKIQTIASRMLVSGELPEGSSARRVVQEIFSITKYPHRYLIGRRRGASQ
ncbi:hypothetical protein A2U01_0065885 [Trifolium medium]|uniref:Uncharacterized protein n=1 Tax=Trifolium medium TaxID=97028 RepID=A0A392S9W2_9FABA|nr:hypothetical protein [Trifolium medium]